MRVIFKSQKYSKKYFFIHGEKCFTVERTDCYHDALRKFGAVCFACILLLCKYLLYTYTMYVSKYCRLRPFIIAILFAYNSAIFINSQDDPIKKEYYHQYS